MVAGLARVLRAARRADLTWLPRIRMSKLHGSLMLTRLTLSTAVLVWLVACAPASKPPFDLSRRTPEKVLDVIEWLGSLDLSRPDPVMEGLRLTPELQRRSSDVLQIYSGPMRNGSNTRLDYYIYDPNGAVAREHGGITRAFLRWMLRSEGIYFRSVEACVHLQDLRNRFGSPLTGVPIPDGGGISFLFHVSSWGGWQTYTAGSEGPGGDCIDTLSVRQTDN